METEAQPVPEAATERDDVHADVRAAFEAHAPAVDTVEGEKPSPARDDGGKFTKAAGQESDAATVTDADPAEGKITEPSKAAEPPTSWSADAKAKWSALDPSIQAEIAKRENDMHDGGRKWSEEKRHYEEVLAPVRAVAQRNGVDEREGLTRLLAANDYLERDPAAAIQWLAKAYGVDLSNVEQTLSERPVADPAVTALVQKVSSLETSIAERERAEVTATLDTFAKAPGHEHYNEVKKLMGHLMQTGQADSLDDAYEKAAWATPSVREKLIAAQTGSQDATRKAKERETAEKAKRAAISVNGSPAAGSAPAQKKDYDTVEDAVRAAYAQHMGA